MTGSRTACFPASLQQGAGRAEGHFQSVPSSACAQIQDVKTQPCLLEGLSCVRCGMFQDHVRAPGFIELKTWGFGAAVL